MKGRSKKADLSKARGIIRKKQICHKCPGCCEVLAQPQAGTESNKIPSWSPHPNVPPSPSPQLLSLLSAPGLCSLLGKDGTESSGESGPPYQRRRSTDPHCNEIQLAAWMGPVQQPPSLRQRGPGCPICAWPLKGGWLGHVNSDKKKSVQYSWTESATTKDVLERTERMGLSLATWACGSVSHLSKHTACLSKWVWGHCVRMTWGTC